MYICNLSIGAQRQVELYSVPASQHSRKPFASGFRTCLEGIEWRGRGGGGGGAGALPCSGFFMCVHPSYAVTTHAYVSADHSLTSKTRSRPYPLPNESPLLMSCANSRANTQLQKSSVLRSIKWADYFGLYSFCAEVQEGSSCHKAGKWVPRCLILFLNC